MELIVRKLWFPHNAEEVVASIFRIPQARQLFQQARYERDMRPRGIRTSGLYVPANPIMDLVIPPNEGVYLILTSRDLKGDYGGINGKGKNKVAIASSWSYTGGSGFSTSDVSFTSMAFGELGHALGLEHHAFDSVNPCEMSHNQIPGPDWKNLESVCFCKVCFKKVK